MEHDHLMGWPPAAREDYRDDSSDLLPVPQKEAIPVSEEYKRIRLMRLIQKNRVGTLSEAAEWPFAC